MLAGETIATGAPPKCPECAVVTVLKVYQSPGGAGFYIGTYCDWGPYSRESTYFKTRVLAQEALDGWLAGAVDESTGQPFGIRT